MASNNTVRGDDLVGYYSKHTINGEKISNAGRNCTIVIGVFTVAFAVMTMLAVLQYCKVIDAEKYLLGLGKTWQSIALSGAITAVSAFATYVLYKLPENDDRRSVYDDFDQSNEEQSNEEQSNIPANRPYSRKERDGVNYEWVKKQAVRRVRNLRR